MRRQQLVYEISILSITLISLNDIPKGEFFIEQFLCRNRT